MQEKPVLAVFGMDRVVRDYLMNAVRQAIGNLVEIEGYSMDAPHADTLHADLVLSSSLYTYPIAQKLFPGCPVIQSKRVVDTENLEQVLMLPRGTRALVVTHPRSVSEEIIQTLRDLGINHISYEPFWLEKRCDASQIDVIVTPGLLHWCPPELDVPIIDIGTRRLSMETLAQILLFFGFDMSYLYSFEQQYIRQQVQTSQRIRRALERSEALRQQQSVILREIDEGILATDQRGNVVISNPVIQQLFGTASSLQKNTDLRGILRQLDAEPAGQDGPDGTRRSATLLVRYRGTDIYCRKNIVELEDNFHTFYTFKTAAQIEALQNSVRRKPHRKSFGARYTFADIQGGGAGLEAVKARARSFAATDETILITGESGTGKELFAQAIHNASPRAGGPFVSVNLAAFSRSLLESELFGYQEGAFTGAKKGGKLGCFELAQGGTIFLDEIGDAPMHIQLMLLRVLEMREITRVGGEEPIPIDVRVIAATNVQLEEAVRQRKFRLDFYYRLNVLAIQTVPLREMRDEIAELAQTYLKKQFHVEKTFRPDALSLLRRHPWKGNFREFHNAMDYIYYTTQGRAEIVPEDFPPHITAQAAQQPEPDVLLEHSPQAVEVLTAFAENAPAALGRGRLLQYLRERGHTVTEAVLKRQISSLLRAGLLESGVTRQGTRATQAGLEAYARWKAGEKGTPEKLKRGG